MSSRYLGVITLERFLVAERYCESRQASSSTDPRRTLGVDRGGGRGDQPGSRTATGAPAQARHG
jgi:hypothetical protein